ncbi:MAG: polysaccharide pyruvyl transferase family protein, partial [Armatimonadota bacterium]
PSVTAAIQEADALVFPGGSLFQDVTSVQSAMYYAKLVDIAKKNKKKVVMLGQGVGPLTKWLGKNAAKNAFMAADVLCVRDPASVTALKDLGVKRPIQTTADMAFLLPRPELMESSQDSFGVGAMKTIGISVRPWGNSKQVVEVYAKFVQMVSERGLVPMMIAQDAVEDQPLVDQISKACNGKVPELKGVAIVKQLQERIMRMDAVVSMRLHTGILATTVDVPSLMVSYDPKVTAFANMMGGSTPLKIEGLTADRLWMSLEAMLSDRNNSKAVVERKRVELAKTAQGNIDALRSCVG